MLSGSGSVSLQSFGSALLNMLVLHSGTPLLVPGTTSELHGERN